jgi:site-specific DNA-methyltransferase (adenine-specific)
VTVTFVGQKEIPVQDLKPHPKNPNRGDVNSIAESLEQFGQFRSILALPDGTMLAGHHVLQAAKNIGMKTVRVDVIDTDEKTALKILHADNRLADLGLGPDLDLLLKNLEILDGDLAGTGYDDEYVRLLEDALAASGEDADDEDFGAGGGGGGGDLLKRVSLVVEARLADRWERFRKLHPDDSTALASLMGDE